MYKVFKIAMSSLLSFICLSSYLFACPPTSIPQYKLIDLGFQQSDKSEAGAVNDKGQVVGKFWMCGEKHFFLWDETNGITLIDLPKTAEITKINNQGQIAGNYTDASNHTCGFLWDPCCGLLDVRSSDGGNSVIFDINDLGQIVGEFTTKNISLIDGCAEVHAFVWQKGIMTDLIALTGDMGLLGDRSCAVGINNLGQIIGSSNYPIAHKGKLLRSTNRAVVWHCGIIEEIDPCFDGNAVPLSLNNNGLAVFFRSGPHAYERYIINLDSKILQPLTGLMENWTVKINDNDSVLFYCSSISNVPLISKNAAHWLSFKSHEHGSQSYRMEYLGNLFEKIAKSPLKEWEAAYDFNNNNWIVGAAKNIYGESHAILMVPISH